jgi:hypothetical protein
MQYKDLVKIRIWSIKLPDGYKNINVVADFSLRIIEVIKAVGNWKGKIMKKITEAYKIS